MGWRDRASPVTDGSSSGWRSRASAVKPEEPTLPPDAPTMINSAVRGAGQGFTAGFSDELAGGVEALGRKLGVSGLGTGDLVKYQNGEFSSDVRRTTPEEDAQSFGQNYEQGRDAVRAANHAAEKANPLSYGLGQVGSSIATAAATGGTSIPALAAQGAAQGLGNSEADTVGGMALDTTIGGVSGAAIGGLAKGAQKAGSSLMRGASDVLEDVATAPIKAGGEMGLASRALKGVTDAGDFASKQFDKLGELGRQGLGFATGGASVGAQGAAKAASTIHAPIQGAARMTLEQVIPRMGRYGKVLSDAAARGGNSLAASHFILQQQDPEYRRQLQEAGYLDNEN